MSTAMADNNKLDRNWGGDKAGCLLSLNSILSLWPSFMCTSQKLSARMVRLGLFFLTNGFNDLKESKKRKEKGTNKN